MVSVFLATRNRDKSAILQNLLSSLAPGELSFSSALSKNCFSEVLEEGSVLDRARAKAEGHRICCSDKTDILVGSDDAFKIPSLYGDEVLCDSGKITQEILEGAVKPGAVVLLVRAFWIIDLRKNSLVSETENPQKIENSQKIENGVGCITEIPFEYLQRAPDAPEVLNVPGTYPLSKVLGVLNGKKPVAEEESATMDAYYADHSFALREKLLFLPPL